MRKILLPLSDCTGGPGLPGRTDVLRALPHRLRLQNFGLKSLPEHQKSQLPTTSRQPPTTNDRA